MLADGPVYHFLSLALKGTDKVIHLSFNELGVNTHEVYEAFIECCAPLAMKGKKGLNPSFGGRDYDSLSTETAGV